MAEKTEAPRKMPARYIDWNEFADGSWYLLRQGEDFRQDPKRATRAARQWASVNGYRCSARVEEDKVSLKVQFTKVVLR